MLADVSVQPRTACHTRSARAAIRSTMSRQHTSNSAILIAVLRPTSQLFASTAFQQTSMFLYRAASPRTPAHCGQRIPLEECFLLSHNAAHYAALATSARAHACPQAGSSAAHAPLELVDALHAPERQPNEHPEHRAACEKRDPWALVPAEQQLRAHVCQRTRCNGFDRCALRAMRKPSDTGRARPA